MANDIVKTASGPVRGVIEGDIASFKGIPFAAPPIGALRWRAPQPVQPWTDVRDASQFGPACPQGSRVLFPADAEQNEDCLTLNVWAPAGAKNLPVMVWIHGGGFTMGSARTPTYAGTQFARQGIVMVSLHYRLGRLGFFAHPALTKEDPDGLLGNFAIMDQIAALKWVRDNIAQFGGDAGNVTIFGESAGGISINALMATPAARGLFHKAISQSGFGRTTGLQIRAASGPSAEAQGASFAEKHGITGNSADAAAALRALPVEEVIRQAGPPPGTPAPAQTRQPGGAPGGLPYPLIDGILFPEQISETFEAGRQARVPYLAGGTSYEASLFAFVRQAPQRVFDGTGDSAKAQALYVSPTRDAGLGALDLTTDLQVTEPARHLARAITKLGEKAFLYYFSYVPTSQRNVAPGAAHGSELGFMFGQLGPNASAKARGVSDAMVSYWAAFAKNGDPNHDGAPRWDGIGAGKDPFMEFSPDGPALHGDFLKAKLDFLDGIARKAMAR